jgi:Zn-dependent alcohol dehydrogenase
MKMRAAVLEEFREPLAVQEVELAEPRAGEALVRLVACGVCHTDLYTASGADPSGYAPAGRGETLDVVPRLLITGRRVAGSSFGGIKGRDQVPALVDRCMAGEIDVEPFVSHRIALDEVNRGFELMEAQDGIRSVIEFS